MITYSIQERYDPFGDYFLHAERQGYWRMSKSHHPHHMKEEKIKSDCRNYSVMFLLTVPDKILARFLIDCPACHVICYVLPDVHSVTSEPVMCLSSIIWYLVSSKKIGRQHVDKNTQHGG